MKSLRTEDILRSSGGLLGWPGFSRSRCSSPVGRRQSRGMILAKTKGVPGGFTLLELLVVVTIMAVVVAMSASDLSQLMGRFRLNAAAREMASVVELCRFRAISANVEFALVLVESDPDAADGNSRSNRGRYEVHRANPSTTPVTWSVTNDGVYDFAEGPNERTGVSIEEWQSLQGSPGHALPDAVVFSPRGYLLNAASDFTGGVIRVVLRNKAAQFVEQRVVRIDRGGNVQIVAGG